MDKKAVIVILLMILGAIVGALVGKTLQGMPLGGVTGLLIGLPVGMFFVSKKRRWIAVMLLNIDLIVAYLVGRWFGLASTIAATTLTFCVSAFILRDLYDGSEMEALRQHLKLALNVLQGFQIVDQGKTVYPNIPALLFGPRLVIVRPGNAVITEIGTQQAAHGPSIFTTRPFEYIKHIYDLRERQKSLTFDDVFTDDLMPTTVKLCATYALHVSDRARQGQISLTTTEQDALQGIPFRMPDWESATLGAIEQAVRRSIRTLQLEEALTRAHHDQLEQRMLALANHHTWKWSVHVKQIIIQNIQTKPEITTALDSRWRERARAEGMRDALTLLADGYQRAKAAGMKEEEIHQEVLRRTLEQIAMDPSNKFLITPELGELLTSLRR